MDDVQCILYYFNIMDVCVCFRAYVAPQAIKMELGVMNADNS